MKACLSGLVLCCFVAAASAQEYPVRSVRMVVGFPPGSAADVAARIMTPRLADALGQQFIVDNRAGAGSNIAAELVAKSPADGHTILFGTIANTINASLYPKLPFDFARDFAPVLLTTSVPTMLVVHAALPVKSVKELVAVAKKNPGALQFASSGSGTAPHMAGELFKMLAGVDIVHVPYKGSPQAVTDLLAGQVPMMFSPSSTVLPFVKTQRLRALAVTGAARSRQFPELPTVAEEGLAGFEVTLWFGLLAPAGTPASIVNRLNAEVMKVLSQPAVQSQLAAQEMEVIGGTPQRFAEYIATETAKWAKVVKASGARVD